MEEYSCTKVLLVGVNTGEQEDFAHSMEELQALAKACNREVAGIIIQNKDEIHHALYVGTGKIEEIRQEAERLEVEAIVFDNTLSPSQVRNLAQLLDYTICDRTDLILDIFALRAKSKEAKLQVEIARLQYILPRLVGLRANLSRQGGTGGSMSNKGAGETKLELDRRKIEHRITELKKELRIVEKSRDTMRKQRMNSDIPQVALVGYTNAGKSTLMNHLVDRYGARQDKKVFEKDLLFATLDTSVRRIQTENNHAFFLVDTVGFINQLPHDLVEAFHSTLEEATYADLLIQVVDYSDENYRMQMKVTEKTLEGLGAAHIPRVIVFNKADCCDKMAIPQVVDNKVFMAAGKDIGIDELLGKIGEILYADWQETQFLFPYSKGELVDYFSKRAHVCSLEYCESGTKMNLICSPKDREKYAQYCI